jgi:hypothetical protein
MSGYPPSSKPFLDTSVAPKLFQFVRMPCTCSPYYFRVRQPRPAFHLIHQTLPVTLCLFCISSSAHMSALIQIYQALTRQTPTTLQGVQLTSHRKSYLLLHLSRDPHRWYHASALELLKIAGINVQFKHTVLGVVSTHVTAQCMHADQCRFLRLPCLSLHQRRTRLGTHHRSGDAGRRLGASVRGKW